MILKYLFVIMLFTIYSCKINQTKNGVPVGKWKYVSGTKHDKSVITGRYNKLGKEKGTWNYYQNDTLFRKEFYFYPYSVDILYHKNGMVKELGKSYTSAKTWTKMGTWLKFNEKGILTDTITFHNEKTPQN